MIDVSIVLVNYFCSKYCVDVINSIREITHNLNYEIIVVDNSQNEDEFSKLEEINDITLIDAKENLGYGKGNNLGVSYSKGKYLFFLNTDILLINNAIFELFSFMENNPNVGIVGPNLFTRELGANTSYEKKCKSIKSDASIIGALGKRLSKNYFHNYTNKPLQIKGYVSGAALFIRKNLFDSIGGFSKEIFMYAEESLLCYIAQKKFNVLIYNVPSAKVIHFEGASFTNHSLSRVKMFIDGNYIYYKIAFGDKIAIKYLKRKICYLNFKKFFKRKDNIKSLDLELNMYKEKLLEVNK